MDKLWLIIFDKSNNITSKQIDILEEHTIKYKLKAEFPFEGYNYIHKHNLNIVQHVSGHKINYIVSLNKDEGIQVINDYISKQIEYHSRSINRYKNLQEKLELI